MIEHKHTVIRAEIRNPPEAHELHIMKDWFKRLVEKLDMKILSGPYVVYSDMVNNRGFTGVCIIETSHIAVHVWDEGSPALLQFDVYTCGKLNILAILNHLDIFEPVKIDYIVMDRKHEITILERSDTVEI